MPHSSRGNDKAGLSDVDLGLRQCLQLLQQVAEKEQLDLDSIEEHWQRLANRAMENLREDSRLFRRQTQLDRQSRLDME